MEDADVLTPQDLLAESNEGERLYWIAIIYQADHAS